MLSNSYVSRCVPRRARTRGEEGLATLELALVLPWLLVLMFGAFTFGHMYYLRGRLAATVYSEARRCAIAGEEDGQCRATAMARIDAVARGSCSLTTSSRNVQLPGLRSVSALELWTKCEYQGGIGADYLRKINVTISNFTVSAVVPYFREP